MEHSELSERQTGPTNREVALLVRAAARGDQRAWEALVERYAGLLWATARAHRLSAADAAEIVQTTWLRRPASCQHGVLPVCKGIASPGSDLAAMLQAPHEPGGDGHPLGGPTLHLAQVGLAEADTHQGARSSLDGDAHARQRSCVLASLIAIPQYGPSTHRRWARENSEVPR